MAEGPFPEDYEPFETLICTNPLYLNVVSNPAELIIKDDLVALRSAGKFLYFATTYRLTKHFHG
ncbi:MAG: hypothetical protein G5663_06380 [Serratia symbiotica]|nr:hypothetical protein [Serratia symbiotica]